MKIISILINLGMFLICMCCIGQTTNFELEDDKKLNLKVYGKAKTVQIRIDDLKSNTSDSLIYFFNSNGSADKIISYSLGFDAFFNKLAKEEVHYIFKNKKLLSKLNKLSFDIDGDVYEYDDNMNLLSLKNYYANILVKETSFKYDSNNREVEKTEYLYGAYSDYDPKTQSEKSKYLYEIETYVYNNRDKVASKLTYRFRENKTVEITQYKYDSNDNIIEECHCISYGEPNCDCKPVFGWEYNSKNQIIKKFQLAKFSPHNTDEYFFYDENGNETEIKGFYIYTDKEPILGYHFKSEYDKNGNKTKEVGLVGSNNSIGFDKYKTQISEYDKFGNLIMDEYLRDDGSIVKMVTNIYTYDKKGNWLKKETFEGNNKSNLQLIQKSERVIRYF